MCNHCTPQHIGKAAVITPALPVCHITVINSTATTIRVVCGDPGPIREFARDAVGELFGKALSDLIETTIPSFKHRMSLWGKRHGVLFEVLP